MQKKIRRSFCSIFDSASKHTWLCLKFVPNVSVSRSYGSDLKAQTLNLESLILGLSFTTAECSISQGVLFTVAEGVKKPKLLVSTVSSDGLTLQVRPRFLQLFWRKRLHESSDTSRHFHVCLRVRRGLVGNFDSTLWSEANGQNRLGIVLKECARLFTELFTFFKTGSVTSKPQKWQI